MALLHNKTITAQYPLTQTGGVSPQSRPRFGAQEGGPQLNLYAGYAGIDPMASVPGGYYIGTTWYPPRVAGQIGVAADPETGMAGVGDMEFEIAAGMFVSTTEGGVAGVGAIVGTLIGDGYLAGTVDGSGAIVGTLIGDGYLVATLAGAGAISGELLALLNMAATLSGSGDITGTLAGLASMEATLAGSGDITAALAGGAFMVALIAGTGAISGDVVGVWNMEATLSGAGAVSSAGLGAIGELVAQLNGTGAITGTMRADGFMEAVITVCAASGELTPGEIADAVWEALVADYTTNGSFGAAVGFLYYVNHHKVITDPVAGTYDVYGDDDVTVIFTGSLWEDAAGTQPYQGSGAERRDRLNP